MKTKKDLTYCHLCNRGGNGNDKDKCSAGWKHTEPTQLGCFIGSPIVGEIKPKKKISKSKQRYNRYLSYGDGFKSFLDYCYWDASKERSWNKSV
jgi:hypothetical protein